MSFSGLKDAEVAAALDGCKGDSSDYMCTFPLCLCVCPSVCMCNRVVKAPALLSDAGTFNHKKFFQACGLSAKSEAEVKSAFDTIDQDKSGFIEEEELK